MQPPERNERTLKKKRLSHAVVCTVSVSLLVRSTKYISFAHSLARVISGRAGLPGQGLLGPLAKAGGTDGSWSGGTNTEIVPIPDGPCRGRGALVSVCAAALKYMMPETWMLQRTH